MHTINQFYKLKLIDLSAIGLVPNPKIGTTYQYIEEFIKLINKHILEDNNHQDVVALAWKRHYELNLKKI